MFVGEIMSKELVTLTPDKNIGEALKLMLKHDIRHIPVVDPANREKLVGFVTSRVVKESMHATENDTHHLKPHKIEEVMQKKVSTVTSKTYVQDAAKIIYKKKFGGLPVVDNGKLMGIITYQDIIGVFIELMDGLQKSSRIDVKVKKLEDIEEIKALLEAEDCELIGIGQVSEKEDEDIYSFRIKHRETQPLCNLLSDAGYRVLEHFC